MAIDTLSQASSPSSLLVADATQFKALEQRVDVLTTQMQQLTPLLAGSKTPISKSQKFNLSRMPSFQRPVTPESLPGTPDIDVPGSKVVLIQDDSVAVTDRAAAKLAAQILDIIQRYGKKIGSEGGPWPGKAKFLPLFEAYVLKNEPVQMVLPAFPFKSPNRRDKTLGSLPDLGEELALMHLNGLCESIAEIYEQGANVVITSDGLVYNGKRPPISPEQYAHYY